MFVVAHQAEIDKRESADRNRAQGDWQKDSGNASASDEN